MFKIRIIKNL